MGQSGIEYIATLGSILLVICTFPFSLVFCVKIVQEYERVVIFRLGRLKSDGAVGPGIFFVLPCVDQYSKVDLRIFVMDVSPQEALTRDAVTIGIDAVVFCRVKNPVKAITQVTNYSQSTKLLAMTILRNILGTQILAQILSEPKAISSATRTLLDVATDPWGIQVERVEM